VSSINGAGKTQYLHVRNKIGVLSHTIHKNQYKIDLDIRPEIVKTIRKRYRGTVSLH
jgi:hypothetical protein